MSVLISGGVILLAVTAILLAHRLYRARRDLLRLQRRVARLEREAAHVDRAKQRFLGSITHELRTPLTAILGYQELLADGMYGEVDEHAREPVARIGSAAEHLLQLIDGVLELARLDAGRLELDLGPVVLDELLHDAADHAANHGRERGVDIDVALPGHLPRITSDPERLRHAIGLALIAAVRASTDATLRIDARTDDDGAVRARIRGTGLALGEYSPERVFGGFESVPEGHERVGRTGLRLSIARRLLRRLGGDLTLEREGESTTVHLRVVDAPLLVRASASGG